MKNRLFATTLLTAAAFVLSSCEKAAPPAETKAPFNVVEATIPEMQKAMQEGRVTSEELVKQYLIRIATYENVINAAIAVNPQALAQARALDEERKAGKVRRECRASVRAPCPPCALRPARAPAPGLVD